MLSDSNSSHSQQLKEEILLDNWLYLSFMLVILMQISPLHACLYKPMSVHGRVQRATLRLEIVGNSKQQIITVKFFI